MNATSGSTVTGAYDDLGKYFYIPNLCSEIIVQKQTNRKIVREDLCKGIVQTKGIIFYTVCPNKHGNSVTILN